MANKTNRPSRSIDAFGSSKNFNLTMERNFEAINRKIVPLFTREWVRIDCKSGAGGRDARGLAAGFIGWWHRALSIAPRATAARPAKRILHGEGFLKSCLESRPRELRGPIREDGAAGVFHLDFYDATDQRCATEIISEMPTGIARARQPTVNSWFSRGWLAQEAA